MAPHRAKGASSTNITFITPASKLRRLKVYQMGQHMYGTRDSITGPLVLAGICKEAGHHVEAYEEFNGSFDLGPLLEKTDVLCLYTMTPTAPRAYWFWPMAHGVAKTAGHDHVGEQTR